jgi:hypothetical protein
MSGDRPRRPGQILLRGAAALRHDGAVNADQVAALRQLLAPTGWLDRTRYFGRALRQQARTPAGLLVVGTPDDEPWHMTAHLADEARLANLPGLAPVLVRWAPPPGAPPHLAVGISRLERAARNDTLLVVSAGGASVPLLERLAGARKTGATIFALDEDDPELDALAHESLPVPPGSAPLSFDAAQHLVSAAAGERDRVLVPAGPAGGGLRRRLARLLDAVSGTPVE